MKKIIGVMGKSAIGPDNVAYNIAYELGKLIGKSEYLLLTGGRDGVMEAAHKGCKEVGGLGIAILPSSKEEANRYVDIGLVSGMGWGRNMLNSQFSDVIIAVGGFVGTLSEIAQAANYKKPIIIIRGSGGISDKIELLGIPEFKYANSPQEAFDMAKKFLEEKNGL